VDDESDSRILLSHLIQEFGCQVIMAPSAEQGLQVAREHSPDVIVLDLLMPGMTGREMMAAMHADAALRDIPVIVVSIVAGELQGAIVGPVDFLDKPADRDRLLEVLSSQLRPSE
jgi:CheY-like chemotaxis protein